MQIRFVYSEILKLANGDESSVFIHFGPSPYEYQLRPGLRFHFFSSHTPCGDASIFPKNDVSLETENEDIENGATTAKRQKLDLDSDDIYRTGAKCVPGVAQDEKRPGAGYHQLGVARSKPGRGAVSLSMATSHCVSHQSLLPDCTRVSYLFRCPYNESAMRRALCDRLSPLEDAPPLEFHYSSQVFCHSRSQVVKNSAASAVPCASSIMWWLGSDRATHVGVNGYKQGTTRKKLAKPSSRLPVCRRELFRQFYRLLHELTYYTAPQSLRGIIVTTYSDFKKAAIAYQERKTDFHTRLPGWTTKSPELQNFIIREDR
ncbi:hypothetical protein V5799_008200 [Amblyomma americanum]|uniref:tRNA-specific adenosine deaminase 1 n=1 Tax=Amblyomma americanum TaxID=6943 RepID=A0AAQ4FFE7_AMBAM